MSNSVSGGAAAVTELVPVRLHCGAAAHCAHQPRVLQLTCVVLNLELRCKVDRLYHIISSKIGRGGGAAASTTWMDRFINIYMFNVLL